ncbi:MAG: hypothetical protein IJ503_01250 [Akkermansia sp.]|nr:hypothetical protein [Akkermansia sp.]
MSYSKTFNEHALRQQYSGLGRDELEEKLTTEVAVALDELREKMGLECKDYAYDDYSQLNKNRLIDQLIILGKELYNLEEKARRIDEENERKKAAEEARKQAEKEEEDIKKAEELLKAATDERQKAEAERRAAEDERLKAEEERKTAEAERRKTEELLEMSKKAGFDKEALLAQYANANRKELVNKLHRLGKSLDNLRSALNLENKNYGQYKYAEDFFWNENRLRKYLIELSAERFELINNQPFIFLENILDDVEERIETLTEDVSRQTEDLTKLNDEILVLQEELITDKEKLQLATTKAQSDAATIHELQQKLAAAEQKAATPIPVADAPEVKALTLEIERLRRSVNEQSEKKKKSDMANAELRTKLSQVIAELNKLKIALHRASRPTAPNPTTSSVKKTQTSGPSQQNPKKRRINIKDLI